MDQFGRPLVDAPPPQREWPVGLKILVGLAVLGVIYFVYVTMNNSQVPATPPVPHPDPPHNNIVPVNPIFRTGGPLITVDTKPVGPLPTPDPEPPHNTVMPVDPIFRIGGPLIAIEPKPSIGAVVRNPEWSYKGCYTDEPNRVLPDRLGDLDWSTCRDAAVARNYNMFGMQYHDGHQGTDASECWAGKDLAYDRAGAASSCSFVDSTGHTHGSAWSNAVYKLE
jgi:hypothetical protein